MSVAGAFGGACVAWSAVEGACERTVAICGAVGRGGRAGCRAVAAAGTDATTVDGDSLAGTNQKSLVRDELSHGVCWPLVASCTLSRTCLNSCSICSRGCCAASMNAAVYGLCEPAPSVASVPGAVE